jgi:hypothetical protein
MGTIQAKSNPQSRLDAGTRIREGSKTVDTTPIKAKLAAFTKIMAAYTKANKAVMAAEAKLDAAQVAVAEADAAQDAAVTTLAAKMIGDEAPKANPFKIFKLAAPSTIIITRVEEEVKTTAKLAKRAAGWKDASPATKAAANKLGNAAALVAKALTKVPPFEKAHRAAIAQRDALGIPWTRTLAKLKNAARVAEDDGHRGIFAALFGVTPTRPAKRAVAKKPTPTPPATPPPDTSSS